MLLINFENIMMSFLQNLLNQLNSQNHSNKMTRSVYKKLPSKNQKVNKNKKENVVVIQAKQLTSSSRINTQKKQNKTKYITKKNKKVTPRQKISKISQNQPTSQDQPSNIQNKYNFKDIQRKMLYRKIQQNDSILKSKPYFNYFHCKDYEKDPRKCDNCFDSQITEENEMLYCEECNSFLHKLCYSVSQDQFDLINKQETEDECNFTFVKCESCLEREINPEIDIQCLICQRDIGMMKCFYFDSRRVKFSSKKNKQYSDYEYFIDKTPVLLLNEEQIKNNKYIKRVFAHPLCINSSSCLFIYHFKFLLIWDEEDYKKKSNQGKKYKCSQCNQGNGLLIQCEHQNKQFPSCKQFYHPLCAAEKKMIYYQQGMRLIHQNQSVRYSDKEENITYYYIICNNHIAQIFQQKQSYGFFNDKQQIYSQLKMNTEEEQKNYDDWIQQMIDEYGPQNKNKDQMSVQLNQNKEIKDSQISKDVLSHKIQDISVGISNLEQFYYQKNDPKRQKESKEPSSSIDSSQQEVSKKNNSVVQNQNQNQPASIHFSNWNQSNLKFESQHEKGKQKSQDLKNVQSDENKCDKFQAIDQNNQDDETDNIYKLNIFEQQRLIVKNDIDLKQQFQSNIKQNSLEKQKQIVNYKAIELEKIFLDKFMNQKKEFENKITQKKSLSNEKLENLQPKILNQKEQQKQTKSQKNIQNVLKRELGLDLPSPQKKKVKKLQQKKIFKANSDDEEQEEEKDFLQGNNNQETEIETRILDKQAKREKFNKKNINEKCNESKQSDESFQNTRESSSENSEQEQQNQLRRSSRVKRAPVSLDNNIFTIYEQKKSSLKEKDVTSNESKQSSSDTKQIEEINLFSSSTKKQKQTKNKPNSQKQNKFKKSKENIFSNDEEDKNIYQSNDEDSGLSDYFYSKSKPKKKIKWEDDQNQVKCEKSLKFDDLESSAEEGNKNKKNIQQKQKKINYRNLDQREDESLQEENSVYNNDSFQLMLDSSLTEQEELQDLGYIIDKLNQYENKENLESKQVEEDEDIEDDIPIDLPDLTSHFFYDEKEEQSQSKTIFQLESNINILEQKIFFLKEDSKLKKYSILNHQNFEMYQQKELKRLMSRKEMLEQQIQQKKKIKIEKYRQQLHYFDQILDLKCLPNIKSQNFQKCLKNNIDKQVPSFRLIKYKLSQNQDFSKEIPLNFQICDLNSKFEIIGFSTLTKVNIKQKEHANLIHNFFSFQK
ncbi:PHD-zinc-finger-like domain protein (macronuclear) [Tetrahymena thermophila SB210]|uniref:PHD-zinc-finger-like domain protein n=1 Tax=Tetrahymena thermophila (strain SB210) TaxID=312017 RepID=I7LTZ8_TETTS|nr:PHD-zinc-finger-like domain protein [Tetrahymena thermophila SB210]EAR87599.2 PHD-zinc-finger-like domain protein [Tetrahymena thermophila SB210]|eukprot:XP_001007844.2 PHD-zinc-finger-like domain protein [Tetrahymena thermophila SB210]